MKLDTLDLALQFENKYLLIQTIQQNSRNNYINRSASKRNSCQKSLQQEWEFVQRVARDIRMDFQLVEYALRDIFLLDLFQGAMAQIPGRAITGMMVKQAGIALPDTTWTAG